MTKFLIVLFVCHGAQCDPVRKTVTTKPLDCVSGIAMMTIAPNMRPGEYPKLECRRLSVAQNE